MMTGKARFTFDNSWWSTVVLESQPAAHSASLSSPGFFLHAKQKNAPACTSKFNIPLQLTSTPPAVLKASGHALAEHSVLRMKNLRTFKTSDYRCLQMSVDHPSPL
jgi:hypothetical protein